MVEISGRIFWENACLQLYYSYDTPQQATGMLYFRINAHSGVPVYRQLMEQIRHYVAGGVLAAGAALPSIRELAKSLAVNPATIVKAYGELAHEGVIVIQHGRGAFVAERQPGWPAARRRERLRVLATQLAVEARQMGAADQETFDALQRALSALGSSSQPPQSNT
jgi:GntR family transcriptional regulator